MENSWIFSIQRRPVKELYLKETCAGILTKEVLLRFLFHRRQIEVFFSKEDLWSSSIPRRPIEVTFP